MAETLVPEKRHSIVHNSTFSKQYTSPIPSYSSSTQWFVWERRAPIGKALQGISVQIRV
ncbi:nudC domain-containing protein 2 [Sesbania bispinosa]|nr:nudC domain-containing protein 2 [Sesbania bispinosa]